MIVLINPPFVDKRSTHFQWFEQSMFPNPALTIFAGLLHEHDIPYLCIDGKLDKLTHEEVLKEIADELGDRVPVFIGVTNSNTTLIYYDLDMVRLLKMKYPLVPIVMGGPHVTALPEKTLLDCKELDVVCRFEGTEVLLELYDCFSSKNKFKTIEEVKGIVYRDNSGAVKKNPLRDTKTMDTASFGRPRWEEFSKADNYFIFTAIGCPYRCSYCFNVTSFKFNVKPIDIVIEELKILINMRGMKHFTFADGTFAVNVKYTKELLLRMISEGMVQGKISWDCQTRVNILDEELVFLMKKCGCDMIAYGVESGSNKVLKRANKSTNTDQISDALRIANKYEIHARFFLIFGHIGETLEDMKETVELIVKLNPDSISVGLMTPWPGTEVYELAERGEEGFELATNDFRKFDKYFGEALINHNVELEKLESLRNQMYLGLYLKNKRYLDFVKFIWHMKRPIARKTLSLIKAKMHPA